MRRIPRCVVSGLLVGAFGACWGCGTSDIQVLLAAGGPDAGIEAQASGPDAQTPKPDGSSPLTALEYCQGSGPPGLVQTAADGGTTSICPDQLAQRAFLYALCTCAGYTSSQALITDAFDGAKGAYGPSNMTAGGSVGVNGALAPGPMTINGSLWASNMTDITSSTAMKVSGDLHAQGEMHPTSSLVVQGNAWMAMGIQTSGDVTVNGTLHVPAAAPTSVAGMFTYGAMDTMSFPYAPACDCDASQFVDVASVVRTGEAQNDDEALGILPTMLENDQSDAGIPPLPCGRIFLTRIGGDAPIHLIAPHRVALFVKGDLSTSDFRIDVPPGGELDLFVAGNVNVRGVFQVGDPSNPARARTYVGGTSVNLRSAATLAGNLYAPAATVTLGGTAPTTLYGAMFAQRVSSGSDLTIHYDKAILTPSSMPACAAPTSCTTGCDCSGQACNSLTCGPCADSSQCCAPLVCNAQGACVAELTPR